MAWSAWFGKGSSVRLTSLKTPQLTPRIKMLRLNRNDPPGGAFVLGVRAVKTIALAFAAAAVLALSGCATPTPYQPAADMGGHGYAPGYTDTRLEDNRYRITFAGNDA